VKNKFKAWLKKYFLNWPAPVYVLLLAAFPVLYFYAYNVAETTFEEAALPLALSLAGAMVLWALLTLILRNARKAGLGTVLFLVFFFTYGRFCDGLGSLGVFVPKHAYLLSGMLFVWGYCIYFISRAKRDFRTTTTVLNVVAVALIAINLFNIASYQIKLARLSAGTPEESPAQSPAASNLTNLDTLPDIYFIIIDEYAHPDTMKEWYDYDNSEFIDSLEEKGVFVASESRTRAMMTAQCLAQVLNMEYLTPGWDWSAEVKNYVEHETNVEYYRAYIWNDVNFRKIAYNAAADFLRAQGYQYIAIAHWGGTGKWNSYLKDNADLYFNYSETGGARWTSEFQKMFWNTTMLRPFYIHLIGSQYEIYYKSSVLAGLDCLKQIPSVSGPKFIYAHFWCPHQPYVFSANGEYIAPVNHQNAADKQFYLGQYIFISAEMEKVIDDLLEKSEIPPIIILQSDHGQRPHHPGIVIGGDEWHKILNAMYLPGVDYSELRDSISPVNTFRLIFNHYFGAEYELLKDD
jgi:hypothetical protein